jgi:hypothetical protein
MLSCEQSVSLWIDPPARLRRLDVRRGGRSAEQAGGAWRRCVSKTADGSPGTVTVFDGSFDEYRDKVSRTRAHTRTRARTHARTHARTRTGVVRAAMAAQARVRGVCRESHAQSVGRNAAPCAVTHALKPIAVSLDGASSLNTYPLVPCIRVRSRSAHALGTTGERGGGGGGYGMENSDDRDGVGQKGRGWEGLGPIAPRARGSPMRRSAR